MEKRFEEPTTHTHMEIQLMEHALHGKATMKVDGIINLVLQLHG
jgi:hypothetical protein